MPGQACIRGQYFSKFTAKQPKLPATPVEDKDSDFMQITISRPFALTGAFLAVTLSVFWLFVHDTSHKTAPDIVFPLIDGREISLTGLTGQTVFVTFWATSCTECRNEIPQLISLYDELAETGLEVIAVAMPYDPPNRVLELSRLMDIPYPVALDIHGDAVRAFGNVAATPSSFVISPHGRIISHHTGAVEPSQLRRIILQQLKSTNNAMVL